MIMKGNITTSLYLRELKTFMFMFHFISNLIPFFSTGSRVLNGEKVVFAVFKCQIIVSIPHYRYIRNPNL